MKSVRESFASVMLCTLVAAVPIGILLVAEYGSEPVYASAPSVEKPSAVYGPVYSLDAEVVGPTEVPVGKVAEFGVEGIGLDELKGSELALFPEGVADYWRVLADLETGEYVPVFQSNEPGEFVVLLAYWNGTEVELAKHDFVVVGEPNPNPEPNPDPEPPPDTDVWILFLYESDTVDDPGHEQMANVISSQRIRDLESDEVDIDFVDKDTTDETGEISEDILSWLEFVEGNGIELPIVVFVYSDESYKVVSWPVTVDDAVEMIERRLP